MVYLEKVALIKYNILIFSILCPADFVFKLRCNFTYFQRIKSGEKEYSCIKGSRIFVDQTFKVSPSENFSVQSLNFKNCEIKIYESWYIAYLATSGSKRRTIN